MTNRIRPDIIGIDDVAALIPDGVTVAVSGSGGGLIEPDQVLEVIERSFLEREHPRDLTLFHSFGIGDRDRRGANRFAHEGMTRRVIASHWTWSPRMMDLAARNRIEAYSLPAGVLSQLEREIGARRPGLLTRTGLHTFVDPRQSGGRVNDVSRDELVKVQEIDGREYLFYPALPIDVAIIRGTAIDDRGNVSLGDEAATLDVYALALAAYGSGGITIVQVKERVAHLSNRDVDIPASLLTYAVVVPEQWQTYVSEFEPTLAGEVPLMPMLEGMPSDIAKGIIARRAALEVEPGTVLNVGFGASAHVIDRLAETGGLDAITTAIEQGHYGGYPASGDQFGMAHGSQALLSSVDQFDVFGSGRLDMTALGMGEVSRSGDVNVSRLAGRNIGPGGFIDISQNAAKAVFCGTLTTKGLRVSFDAERGLEIVQEGAVRKFVNEVDQITFNGSVAHEDGREAIYVTERAVFRLTGEGLELIEVAPGIDIEQDVVAQMEFRPIIREVQLMPAEVFG